MPRRTNIFQEVVAIIHRHMAPGAEVTESAEFRHALTNRLREVDVAITSKVAGHEVIVCVEATKTGRRADATWVEQQVGKHRHLPTSKLVLVSDAGFTKGGRELAIASNAIPIEPQDLGEDDPAFVVVNKLRSIWPKIIEITPERVWIWTERPDGLWGPMQALVDMDVILEGEDSVGTLAQLVNAWVRGHIGTVSEQIGLADIEEDRDQPIVIEATGWAIKEGDARRAFCLRYEPPGGGEPELHPIAKIRVVGHAKIRVLKVDLSHGRLGEVLFAQGEGRFGGKEALFVVTEDEEGGKLTIRTRDVG